MLRVKQHTICTRKCGSPYRTWFYSIKKLSKISLRQFTDSICFVNIQFYPYFNFEEYIYIFFLNAFCCCNFYLVDCCSCLNMLYINQQYHVLGKTFLVPWMRKNIFLPKQVEASHACSQWGKTIQLWRLQKGF